MTNEVSEATVADFLVGETVGEYFERNDSRQDPRFREDLARYGGVKSKEEHIQFYNELTDKRWRDFVKSHSTTTTPQDLDNPSHYTQGSIQPLDFIIANDLDFCSGNVIKYVVRAPYKGKQLSDLKKARIYLDRLIESVGDEANA